MKNYSVQVYFCQTVIIGDTAVEISASALKNLNGNWMFTINQKRNKKIKSFTGGGRTIDEASAEAWGNAESLGVDSEIMELAFSVREKARTIELKSTSK